MTYQGKLHEERESQRVQQAEARHPSVHAGCCDGKAGIYAQDKGGRNVFVQIHTTEQIANLIAELQEVKAALEAAEVGDAPPTQRSAPNSERIDELRSSK
jgi:hypothetical protein